MTLTVNQSRKVLLSREIRALAHSSAGLVLRTGSPWLQKTAVPRELVAQSYIRGLWFAGNVVGQDRSSSNLWLETCLTSSSGGHRHSRSVAGGREGSGGATSCGDMWGPPLYPDHYLLYTLIYLFTP